jgi:hypothetical protein
MWIIWLFFTDCPRLSNRISRKNSLAPAHTTDLVHRHLCWVPRSLCNYIIIFAYIHFYYLLVFLTVRILVWFGSLYVVWYARSCVVGSFGQSLFLYGWIKNHVVCICFMCVFNINFYVLLNPNQLCFCFESTITCNLHLDSIQILSAPLQIWSGNRIRACRIGWVSLLLWLQC